MTALQWAIVWAFIGAVVVVVAVLIEPDTGHIPRKLVPLMVAVPSAAFGAIAGLIFASVTAPVSFGFHLGRRETTLVGAAIGGATGFVFMNLLAHSVVTIVLGVLLGALLAFRSTRPETSLQTE